MDLWYCEKYRFIKDATALCKISGKHRGDWKVFATTSYELYECKNEFKRIFYFAFV